MLLLMRLVAEEDGQDVIEYALLTAAIGLCALAAFSLWSGAINKTYNSWNTSTNQLWDPEPKP
jgi:Flp pilus assembly pilin Flp